MLKTFDGKYERESNIPFAIVIVKCCKLSQELGVIDKLHIRTDVQNLCCDEQAKNLAKSRKVM